MASLAPVAVHMYTPYIIHVHVYVNMYTHFFSTDTKCIIPMPGQTVIDTLKMAMNLLIIHTTATATPKRLQQKHDQLPAKTATPSTSKSLGEVTNHHNTPYPCIYNMYTRPASSYYTMLVLFRSPVHTYKCGVWSSSTCRHNILGKPY